jgi:integrase
MASHSRNNVRKRGNTWTYYVYVTDGTGKRNQVSKGGFRTRKEAEAARVEALAALQTGTFVKPEKLTVEQFLVDEWLPTQRPPTLEESTYRSYERNILLHVIPSIGGAALQKLTPMDLNALYRQLLDRGRCPTSSPKRRHDPELVELVGKLRGDGLTWRAVADEVGERFPEHAGISKDAIAALWRRHQRPPEPTSTPPPGLSPTTVRYIHTIIHAALKDAMRWNRVVRNVADASNPPSVGSTKKGKLDAWSADELRTFLDHVALNRYLPPWILLATTACRRGEALGLKWQDVDLDAGTAVLSTQVTSVNHKIIIKELPKTKRGHLIRLDAGTVEVLRRWRARQNEEKLLLGPGYRDDGWVFCQADGSVYHPERFSREFKRKQDAFRRAGGDRLPELKLHGLRHTWATLALAEGIDIHIVSERLGHSSTHITREIYTHVTPPMQSDAAERVAGRIFGGP